MSIGSTRATRTPGLSPWVTRSVHRPDARSLPVGATSGARPPFRESGAGPFVLCVHSFGASSNQYQGLIQRLASRFHVVAADLYGHGRNPSWAKARKFTLNDEAAALEALLPDDGPMHLVGHSYGAAVALRIASVHRDRVCSLSLYEPAMWGTLARLCPGDPATLEIEAVRDDTNRMIDSGRLEAATERFVDYWAGAGSWAAIPAERRPRLIATTRSLPAAWMATFGERWSDRQLRSMDIPCLLMGGTRTTAAASRTARLLRETLPVATVIDLDGLGHLGPLTHPARIDARIDAFLSTLPEEITE